MGTIPQRYRASHWQKCLRICLSLVNQCLQKQSESRRYDGVGTTKPHRTKTRSSRRPQQPARERTKRQYVVLHAIIRRRRQSRIHQMVRKSPRRHLQQHRQNIPLESLCHNPLPCPSLRKNRQQAKSNRHLHHLPPTRTQLHLHARHLPPIAKIGIT